jgi:hypothetical protein
MNALVGGRYQIVGSLGSGGTSLVQRARDLRGGPDVAIKRLRPEFSSNSALRRRFLREGELARRLDDPTIVRVLGVGEDADVPFLVLELVGGATLRRTLQQRRRLDLGAARAIVTPLVRALDHAHAAGIVHRDVKPENVFVNGREVKLGDFGSARVVSLASVTGASLTWGTPEYVAPELFSRGRADPRSDFYSLGAILYEVLTGRPPWSRTQTLGRLTSTKPPPLSPSGAGEAIDRLVTDLLAPDPSDRPASGTEILRRLSEPAPLALTSKHACPACGQRRADDVPFCFSCGQEVLRIDRAQPGEWRVVLQDLAEDAATAEKLLRLMSPLCRPTNRPLLFLTGNYLLYSETERKQGIAFPAVLFSGLTEKASRELEALFRGQGFDVQAIEAAPTIPTRPVKPPGAPLNKFQLAVGSTYIGWAVFLLSHHILAGIATGAGFLALMPLIHRYRRRVASRKAKGLFDLREELAPVPVADHLLHEAATSAAKIRAPEVRALFADVSTELYRLMRQAAELDRRAAESGLQSTERDLERRALLAAPSLQKRLIRLAEQLDALDGALEGTTEGELMASLARLERTAATAAAETSAVDAARRDLQATLERREQAELERARLSAKLCELLGRLRDAYQRTRELGALDDDEAATVEAASAELDAFLATPDRP